MRLPLSSSCFWRAFTLYIHWGLSGDVSLFYKLCIVFSNAFLRLNELLSTVNHPFVLLSTPILTFWLFCLDFLTRSELRLRYSGSALAFFSVNCRLRFPTLVLMNFYLWGPTWLCTRSLGFDAALSNEPSSEDNTFSLNIVFLYVSNPPLLSLLNE